MGSRSSSKFSKRKGFPYWMASSKNFTYSSLKVFTVKPALRLYTTRRLFSRQKRKLDLFRCPACPTFSSFFFNHVTICICGSTQSGQRADLVTKIPFLQSTHLRQDTAMHGKQMGSRMSSKAANCIVISYD